MKEKIILAALIALAAPAFANTTTGTAVNGNTHSSSTKEAITDAKITAKVKAAFISEKLYGDKEVAAMGIKVVTENGVVHLSGEVDNAVKAENAAKIAKTVEGVKEVKSTITVAK